MELGLGSCGMGTLQRGRDWRPTDPLSASATTTHGCIGEAGDIGIVTRSFTVLAQRIGRTLSRPPAGRVRPPGERPQVFSASVPLLT